MIQFLPFLIRQFLNAGTIFQKEALMYRVFGRHSLVVFTLLSVALLSVSLIS